MYVIICFTCLPHLQ